MARIEYAVIAELPDEGVAQEYIAWLTRGGHVSEVVRGGAEVGEVIRLDPAGEGSGPRVMSRYQFPSRAAFEAYERDHAPRLRREGLGLFGIERGVVMRRVVGEVLARVTG